MWVLVQCGTVSRDPNRIGFNPIFALATDLEDLSNRGIQFPFRQAFDGGEDLFWGDLDFDRAEGHGRMCRSWLPWWFRSYPKCWKFSMGSIGGWAIGRWAKAIDYPVEAVLELASTTDFMID